MRTDSGRLVGNRKLKLRNRHRWTTVQLVLNRDSTCAVKRRWSTAGESPARGLGSFHPEAIGAAVEENEAVGASGVEGRQGTGESSARSRLRLPYRYGWFEE